MTWPIKRQWARVLDKEKSTSALKMRCLHEDHKVSYTVYEKFFQPFIYLCIYFAFKIHCGLLEANDPQYPQGDCFQNLKALQSNAS